MRLKYLACLLLLAGCKQSQQTPTPDPSDVVDQYGYPPRYIDRLYTRAGIHIDIVKSLNPEQDFTPDEVALIVKTLDTLTDEELANSQVHVIMPDVYVDHPMWIAYRPDLNLLHFIFNEPKSTRPLDPNLGNLMLDAMGFSKRPSFMPRVYDQATHEYQFPELMPSVPAPMEPLSNPLGPKVLMVPDEGSMIVSPNDPTYRVPLTSRLGHNLLAKEQQMTLKNDYRNLTTQDLLRPHENILVIDPQKN